MISCHLHDYIEIACMYHFPVTLQLDDGREVIGVARDTGIDDDKRECLRLDNHGDLISVVLDQLVSLKANVTNPHFDFIRFK